MTQSGCKNYKYGFDAHEIGENSKFEKKPMKRTSRGLSTRIGLYNIENILTTEIWMSKMSQPVTAKTNTYSIKLKLQCSALKCQEICCPYKNFVAVVIKF